MPSSDHFLLIFILALLLLQLFLLIRSRHNEGLTTRLDTLIEDNHRLREALAQEQRAERAELLQLLQQFRSQQQEHVDTLSARQQERIEDFGRRLDAFTERTAHGMLSLSQRQAEEARHMREESSQSLTRFGDQLQQRLATLTADNERRLHEVRHTLETQLKALQSDNALRLEQMRATVDEKLQSTLETRLGQSFQLVSERLEAVQRGLGEMQSLAVGVGDLKRVLSNVKTRGIFGEVQLGTLLEQMLAPEQYAANIATVPGAAERVEYAIRLPGHRDHTPVWLPIDAKFPLDDYQRLVDAQDAADAEAAQAAGRALEVRLREEAKRIRSKYIAPPHSTDFALLFLPTEGLYAEAIRRPGLSELLQREHGIVLAGPTTLSALLNSLQIGFRTLAIEQRSSEVWQLLGAVKNEFHKFAAILERAEKQLHTVSRSIGEAGKKTRTIERRLRGVETLSSADAVQLLETAAAADAEEDRKPPSPPT